jgi:hypothetical protein
MQASIKDIYNKEDLNYRDHSLSLFSKGIMTYTDDDFYEVINNNMW